MNLSTAVNDLLVRVDAVLAEEEYTDFMLERLYRMKEDIVDPAVRALRARPLFAGAARQIARLHDAVEQYVFWFVQEPARRAKRRRRIERLKAEVRRDFLASSGIADNVDRVLEDIRQWHWRTRLDEQGRLVYAFGGGTVIPGRGAIAREVGLRVIEEAVKAQRPYSDRARPRDVRGNPGGMLVIEDARRAIVVGDLHGRYDNLEHILKDKRNLEDILSGDAHLIFTGDAVHPRSRAANSPEAYEDSFCVMLLVMALKAENPFNVHYLVGNHDHAHVGGTPAARGPVRQDRLFEKCSIERFGRRAFEHYRKFVKSCPVTAKLKTPGGALLLVHAGLSPRVLSEQGLINIFVKGRKGQELRELLWSRNYGRQDIEQCLKNVGARFVITGHTDPTPRREQRYGIKIVAEGVFAHVHELQAILSSHRNTFGYMDIDLLRPLPECVTALRAPDDNAAFRVLRPTKRRSVA